MKINVPALESLTGRKGRSSSKWSGNAYLKKDFVRSQVHLQNNLQLCWFIDFLQCQENFKTKHWTSFYRIYITVQVVMIQLYFKLIKAQIYASYEGRKTTCKEWMSKNFRRMICQVQTKFSYSVIPVPPRVPTPNRHLPQRKNFKRHC